MKKKFFEKYACKKIETTIPDLVIIQSSIFSDNRGFFFESFNQKKFNQIIGQEKIFVQDNYSQSKKGTIRGLHYQIKNIQGKLIRVINGKIYDVVVDLRKSSSNFGKWFGIELSSDNKKQLWIPEGFAHGFLAISDTAECLYKVTDYYNPKFEKCIFYLDTALSIQWPKLDVNFSLSKKDLCGVSWNDAVKFI